MPDKPRGLRPRVRGPEQALEGGEGTLKVDHRVDPKKAQEHQGGPQQVQEVGERAAGQAVDGDGDGYLDLEACGGGGRRRQEHCDSP